jgi:uncharacterized protein YdhG (YjbR/CyaY superfamily)
MAGPSTVDDYLAQLPEKPRKALEKLRGQVEKLAPDTTQSISYQMPTFKYRGRALLGFAAFKNHCSLFPYSKGVLETLEQELEPFDTSGKGTIRFTAEKPLPASLIKKIVKVRIGEIEERNPRP